MKNYCKLLMGAAALALPGMISPAVAETVTLEVTHAFGGHKRFHEPIAEAFMKQHPDIRIKYRTPAKNYGDGHQTVLRQALTNNLPDVWYSGYNNFGELVATLSKRGQITEITPLLKAEGKAWIGKNYAPNVLALAQVEGKQWGMPFNASTPIVYYNLDLVKAAGGDPANLPSDWDGAIALGKKISALGSDVDGLAYSVSEWGADWLWQALIFNFGSDMMNAGKTKVAFDSDAGLKAVKLARRFVVETGMPFLSEDQTIQQFAAGKLGIFFGSTAEVRVMGKLVGDKFAWKTDFYPIADKKNGGLPVGGNTAVILTNDPAKVKAAWEFLKFVSGPEGQKIAVLGSGYMPVNLRATETRYLGDHYKQNPDWTTSMKQWPVAKDWFGYPGGKSGRIWKSQSAILNSIMRGEIDPEAGLKELVETTERLVRE